MLDIQKGKVCLRDKESNIIFAISFELFLKGVFRI